MIHSNHILWPKLVGHILLTLHCKFSLITEQASFINTLIEKAMLLKHCLFWTNPTHSSSYIPVLLLYISFSKLEPMFDQIIITYQFNSQMIIVIFCFISLKSEI